MNSSLPTTSTSKSSVLVKTGMQPCDSWHDGSWSIVEKKKNIQWYWTVRKIYWLYFIEYIYYSSKESRWKMTVMMDMLTIYLELMTWRDANRDHGFTKISKEGCASRIINFKWKRKRKTSKKRKKEEFQRGQQRKREEDIWLKTKQKIREARTEHRRPKMGETTRIDETKQGMMFSWDWLNAYFSLNSSIYRKPELEPWSVVQMMLTDGIRACALFEKV